MEKISDYVRQPGVSTDGQELIKSWLFGGREVDRLERELAKAIRERDIAKNNLARWLLPSDAKNGEVIAVWYGDSLIAASKTFIMAPMPVEGEVGQADQTIYDVKIRSAGRSIREIDL